MYNTSHIPNLQIRLENPAFPSMRLAVRLPSLGFHFSPSRYHRLMQVAKIFEVDEVNDSNVYRPWTESDFEGWLCLLTWKVAFRLTHPSSFSVLMCAIVSCTFLIIIISFIL